MARTEPSQRDSLFDAAGEEAAAASAPLAVRMRPRTLAEVIGQRHLTGEGTPFRKLADHDAAMSLLLWGPPGTGKTTLAQVVSHVTRVFGGLPLTVGQPGVVPPQRDGTGLTQGRGYLLSRRLAHLVIIQSQVHASEVPSQKADLFLANPRPQRRARRNPQAVEPYRVEWRFHEGAVVGRTALLEAKERSGLG